MPRTVPLSAAVGVRRRPPNVAPPAPFTAAATVQDTVQMGPNSSAVAVPVPAVPAPRPRHRVRVLEDRVFRRRSAALPRRTAVVAAVPVALRDRVDRVAVAVARPSLVLREPTAPTNEVVVVAAASAQQVATVVQVLSS